MTLTSTGRSTSNVQKRVLRYFGIPALICLVVLLEWLVVKQFAADRYFHTAMDCVEASITGRNALARPGCVELLKKAISWAPANPAYH
ncbi:MAG: hypothetical protein RBS82_12580, partial [Syntrophales bacterium]|nr:hypothetical protein [Syntrophales bacterium]